MTIKIHLRLNKLPESIIKTFSFDTENLKVLLAIMFSKLSKIPRII